MHSTDSHLWSWNMESNQKIVEDYIYQGQHISMKSSKEASSTFKNKKIPLVLKRRLYNQCIFPIVTYGAETWNLTKRLTLKLRSMQRAHERIMFKLTWRDHKGINRSQWYQRNHQKTQMAMGWSCCKNLRQSLDSPRGYPGIVYETADGKI